MATVATNPQTSDLAKQLAPQTARISALMVDAILREVPRYAAAPEQYTNAVLQRCRLAVRLFFRIVETGDPPGPRDIRVVSRLGRTVAISGEPLEPLLHALRIGARVGWEETLAESRRPPAVPPDIMLPLAGRIFEYIDQLSSSMAEAYSQQVAAAARGAAMSESRVFEALVSGEPATEGLAAMTMEPPRVALALASREESATVSAVLGRLRARLDHGVLGQRHGLPVWLLSREPQRGLLRDCAAGTAVAFGVSAASEEISLSRAVEEATVAATIGLEHGAMGEAFTYSGIYPEAALRSDPAALARFHAATLGPLREHPELLETLKHYFASGRSVGQTARLIHRHRQTAVYRLRRAQELLACDLAQPETAFLIESAIRTLRPAPIDPAAG
jgi:hypothetical protein